MRGASDSCRDEYPRIPIIEVWTPIIETACSYRRRNCICCGETDNYRGRKAIKLTQIFDAFATRRYFNCLVVKVQKVGKN